MTNQNNMLTKPEQRLPKSILDKAIRSTNEFGWRKEDLLEVVETARQNHLAIIGGQVQYVLPGGTCELYWLSYDPTDRQPDEAWVAYCNRTADECIDKFDKLVATKDIEKEALTSFLFLADEKKSSVDISNHLAFILYFDDKETDLCSRQTE